MPRLLLSCLLALMLAFPAFAAESADRIVIDKAERRMTLYDGDTQVAVYRVALGFAPVGDKEREGDGKTPEGKYRINFKNPNSQFTLSLKVSYPDAEDRAEAAARGDDPGGDIFIHGAPGREAPYRFDERVRDWTLGCIAVSDDDIREIWGLVDVGAVVEINP